MQTGLLLGGAALLAALIMYVTATGLAGRVGALVVALFTIVSVPAITVSQAMSAPQLALAQAKDQLTTSIPPAAWAALASSLKEHAGSSCNFEGAVATDAAEAGLSSHLPAFKQTNQYAQALKSCKSLFGSLDFLRRN